MACFLGSSRGGFRPTGRHHFRLPDDRGLINRMGLPNAGADVTARRLAALRPRVPVFANIVKTADLEGFTGFIYEGPALIPRIVRAL